MPVGVRHARLAEPGQGGDRRQRRALGQHRHRAGDRDRVLGQPRQPHDHGPRHRARADLEHDPGVRSIRSHVVGLERGQELA
jgi:hypothetical protein